MADSPAAVMQRPIKKDILIDVEATYAVTSSDRCEAPKPPLPAAAETCMHGLSILAGHLGRFASSLTGAHVSDSQPKSTNRDVTRDVRAATHVHTE